MIIIPRRHYTQPQGRVEIDWSHPMSEGLIFAFDPAGWRNAVTGVAMTAVGGASRFPGPTGQRLRTLASADVLTCPIPRVESTSPLYAYARVTALASNTARKRFLRMSNATAGTILSLDYGNGSVNRGLVGIQTASGFPSLGTDSAPAIGDQDVYFGHDGTASSDGLTIVVDDVAGTTKYGAQTARLGHADTLYLGNNSSSFPWNGYIESVFIWTRPVPPDERAPLRENPWQLFRADPVRIYSFPSGPIIPALSGLTTTNITQSGARHSLTLTF